MLCQILRKRNGVIADGGGRDQEVRMNEGEDSEEGEEEQKNDTGEGEGLNSFPLHTHQRLSYRLSIAILQLSP